MAKKTNTHTLRFPIEGLASELTMRRPKVKDIEAATEMSSSQATIEIMLFATLCGVAADTIRELDLADYSALQEIYAGFEAGNA